jgi:hypothetical protein
VSSAKLNSRCGASAARPCPVQAAAAVAQLGDRTLPSRTAPQHRDDLQVGNLGQDQCRARKFHLNTAGQKLTKRNTQGDRK